MRRKKSKTKRVKPPRPVKHSVAKARHEFDELDGFARMIGVVVRISRGSTDHWMFNDRKGKRLLDYWPGTGTIWDQRRGVKGKVDNCWAALEVAKDNKP